MSGADSAARSSSGDRVTASAPDSFDESGVGRHVRYPLVRAFETCFDLLESDARRSEAAPIHRHRCYKCRGAWFSTEIHLTWGEKRAFTDEELHVLGAWAGSLWFDHSHTREEGYLMWHCPHCQAKQGDFYLRPAVRRSFMGAQ